MRRRWMVGAALLLARAAAAQTNERVYENLDFRFVTPGARAIGMGKAFVGLADDATAAYSNPAGLSNLLAREVSFEVQQTEIRHDRLVSLAPGEPVRTAVFGDTVWEPSFLSVVWPLQRWTASFFVNSVQNYRESFSFEGRPVGALGAPEDGAFGTIAARNQQYGLGAAWVASPKLSFGASLALSALDLASQNRSGTPFDPRNGTDTIDRATRVTAMGGVLVKPARHVSLGASYFGGARFDVETTLFGRFLQGATVDTLHDVVATGTREPIRYVVPPRAALGASWRAAERLTLLGDVSRIWYSHQVGDGFRIVDFQAEAFALSRNNFYVRDVWELHAGAEYRIYGSAATFAVRAGVYTDPDHRLHFRPGPVPSVAATLLDFRFNSLPDRTDVGVTAGAGAMFGNRVQLDAAVSFRHDARELVLSTVLRP